MELTIDSSGLKISGEDERKVKVHGAGKRRGWIKLHIGVDPRSQDLVVAERNKSVLKNIRSRRW